MNNNVFLVQRDYSTPHSVPAISVRRSYSNALAIAQEIAKNNDCPLDDLSMWDYRSARDYEVWVRLKTQHHPCAPEIRHHAVFVSDSIIAHKLPEIQCKHALGKQ